jgi:hypothetical protein
MWSLRWNIATHPDKAPRLTAGKRFGIRAASILLSLWSSINFLMDSLIWTIIIFVKTNAPILVVVFEKPGIANALMTFGYTIPLLACEQVPD